MPHFREASMVVVLIHWKIVPGRVAEFLTYWKQRAVIQDRSGLIGEFLSEAHSTAEFDWITWDVTEGRSDCRSFINVGLWSDAMAFQDQIAKYFLITLESKLHLVVRRAKAPFLSGCESRPATVAPAGSSRSG